MTATVTTERQIQGPMELLSRGEEIVPLGEQITNVTHGECLLEMRDAIQGIADVRYPGALDQYALIKKAERAGVKQATISIFTKCGTIIDTTTKELLLMMRDNQCEVIPSVAIPATLEGAEWAKDLVENYHRGTEVKVFISSAGERRKVHNWSMEDVLRKSDKTIRSLTSDERTKNTRVVSVIEQASQTEDEELFMMIEMSAAAGASGICIADSLSVFGEEEAFECIAKMREYIYTSAAEHEERDDYNMAAALRNLTIEFHGHNDFGKADEAALGALRAGAIPHVTPCGIGERAGNASLGGLYEGANDFLRAHGHTAVHPAELTAAVDAVFVATTYADPADYNPDGDNAHRTYAALHADYIYKIWTQLNEELSKPQPDPDEVARLEYLFKTGYLPRHEGEPVGEHEFGLNPFSNEDVVRMLYRQLSKQIVVDPVTGEERVEYLRDPDDLDINVIRHILWIIKVQNRPLTPMEMEQFLDFPRSQNSKEYHWDR